MATEPAVLLQLRTCQLRPYREEVDVDSLAEAANNPKIARWMRDAFPHPYTKADAKAWISIANSASPLRDFAICSLPDGGGGSEPAAAVVIGGIGLKVRDDIHYRTMEIGYWLSEPHWGRGISTEAVIAFSEWAFETFGHVVRLEAEVFEGNLGSARVLEKAGFEFEGRRKKAVEKSGVVLDALIYCKLRP
ncbi:putative N-acetyltransferase [Cladorrhinum samala]|uniref:N-acetyltransferase n=1 Tax=Cladorrhinum samala TaxID=585594 RepID=A0AAV9HFS8_9PEZI|nr:putative N-acetyltransferase [Cladorrhinum samala]